MINIKDNVRKIFFYSSRESARGYALLEMLFYILLFSILSFAVINAMIAMTRSFKETTIQAELAESSVIMERISKEIRQAHEINTISGSTLKLNTKDYAGVDKTVEFILSGSNIQLLENVILTGNLNTPKITISNLTFTQITTTKGKAVKIFFTVSSTNDAFSRVVDFYNTVVLRGSY